MKPIKKIKNIKPDSSLTNFPGRGLASWLPTNPDNMTEVEKFFCIDNFWGVDRKRNK